MEDVDNKIKMIVEGLLLAAGKPLSLSVISGVFSEDERPDNSELREVLAAIAEDCDDRGFELKEVASGFRFQVKQDVSEWIGRLWEEKPPRYSRALLETLALIAYRQPITRGDIEEIRGVGVSSHIIRTLVDREWVRIVGHKDVPGKPALYATTRQFLDYFNLKSIQELPPLSEIRELAESRGDYDVEDDLVNRTVLEVPEDEQEQPNELVNEDGEVVVFDAGELPDESEAAALSRKPLNEILGLTAEDDEGSGEDEDAEEAAADDHSEAGQVSESGSTALEENSPPPQEQGPSQQQDASMASPGPELTGGASDDDGSSLGEEIPETDSDPLAEPANGSPGAVKPEISPAADRDSEQSQGNEQHDELAEEPASESSAR